jgi:hypothetical protein
MRKPNFTPPPTDRVTIGKKLLQNKVKWSDKKYHLNNILSLKIIRRVFEHLVSFSISVFVLLNVSCLFFQSFLFMFVLHSFVICPWFSYSAFSLYLSVCLFVCYSLLISLSFTSQQLLPSLSSNNTKKTLRNHVTSCLSFVLFSAYEEDHTQKRKLKSSAN